ncbi:MAG: hypothetical protein ACRD0K_26885 [Egibacteraceae bacterium]
MARKKPRAARAYGKVYTIRWCDKGTIKLDGEVCDGLTVHEKQSISIERGQMPDNEADSLIHEHFHQLLRPLHASVMPNDDTEEAIVQALAPALFASFRENPEFWRYILATASPRPRRKKPLTGPPAAE